MAGVLLWPFPRSGELAFAAILKNAGKQSLRLESGNGSSVFRGFFFYMAANPSLPLRGKSSRCAS